MSIFDELKRRNVFRVGVAYIVAAWVLAQVVDLVLEYVTAPDWIMHVFMLFVGIGFIAAVVIAWAYELTPEGIKREADVDRSQSVVTDTGRKLDRIIIAFLAAAVVILLADRFLRQPTEDSEPTTAAIPTEPSEPIQSIVDTETKSIAVLPFVNLSADEDNEFFSDGIAEEILNVLASIPELKVAARTSAFAFKGTNTNISNIAAELGVNHVLEGSVRKAGNQVRVTAQLIQASDGFHLWSANYDRELTNIFAIQDEIAGSIANALKVTLKLEAGSSGNLTGTNSIEAYERYLQGMQLWHQRTAISLNAAIEEFEAAIAIDPDFAKAHSGLALTWAVITGYVNFDDPEITYRNTEDSAKRALELDPENAEALAALGLVARYRQQFQEGMDYLQQAINANPSFASAHQWYAGSVGEMGDPEGSVARYRKARELDPRSRIIGYNLAYRLAGIGKHEEAISILEEVIEYAPDFPDALDLMMVFRSMTGECDLAMEYAQRVATVLGKVNPGFNEIQGICQQDDPGLRRAAYETMLSWPQIDFANAEHPTLFYDADLLVLMVHHGEFDLAFKFIEAQESDLSIWFTWLRSWRTENFTRWQCDPRTVEYERALNLPESIDPINCE